MAGSVFKDVLEDLIAEKHPLAATVRNIMYNRSMVGVTYYSAGACSTHGNTQCPVGPRAIRRCLCPPPLFVMSPVTACLWWLQCHNCTYNTGNSTTDCPNDPHSRKIAVFNCISWSENPFPFGSEFAWE